MDGWLGVAFCVLGLEYNRSSYNNRERGRFVREG